MALIAWYPLNGDLEDYSGNRVKATNIGAVVSDEGKIGKCYNFNGSNQYIKAPTVSETLHGKAEASIAMWVKKKSIQYGFIQLSGYKNNNGNLYPYTTPTNVYLDVFRKNRLGPIEMPTSTLEWHHLVITQRPGAEGWRLYQNGKLVHKASADNTVSTDYYEFEIGRNSNSRYANAYFNDVRVYDHALSEKEIEEIAKAKVLHYKLDDAFELFGRVTDSSGYENHGITKLGSSPHWSTDSALGFGSASLNGESQYFETAYLNKTDQFSISLWFKADTPISGSRLFWGKGSNKVILYTNSNDTLSWYATTDVSSTGYIPSTLKFDKGKWNHVVLQSDSENIELFINGIKDGSSRPHEGSIQPGAINIGTNSAASGNYFKGEIDDLRVYATALSERDIKELYTSRANIDNKGLLHSSGFEEDLDWQEDIKNTNLVGQALSSSTPKLSNTGVIKTSEFNEVGLPVRYIRETMNGSSANGSNHWTEIQAYDHSDTNVALNAESNHSLITDGNTSSSPYASGQQATVDLGEIKTILSLKIWHYWADGRIYKDILTEVSANGKDWITVFNSNVDGQYNESSEGNEIFLRPERMSFDEKGNIFVREINEV